MACCTNTYDLGCYNYCSVISFGESPVTGLVTGVFTSGNLSIKLTITATTGQPFVFDLSYLNEDANYTLQLFDSEDNLISATIDSVVYDCFTLKTKIDGVAVNQGVVTDCTFMCEEVYDPTGIANDVYNYDNFYNTPTNTSEFINDGADGIHPFITAEDVINPTLENVLIAGNITNGSNISISDGDAIILDNGSKLKKGTTDNFTGGAKGIALKCSVDYELKWEAGRLFVMEQDGFTIREVSHNFIFTPSATDDDTKGYVVGSKWILDNLDVYECVDNTTGSAVWQLYKVIPTNTSQLTNDGQDGINPFITLNDLPALSGYVPYTGAINSVDLGTYNLTADHIALNVSPSGAGFVEGATQWNNTIGSSETLLKGGSVTLKNGVDLVARVVNNTGIQLTKSAYQVVKVSGAQGQRLAVGLAQANNDNNSADTLGIAVETINNNAEGFILSVGQIEDINTTGSLQGETWADGDVLYLSPTTAGRITNIKPTGATGHIVVIGYVEYAHVNHGKIYVKIMNGWELDELHNVYINGVTDGQVLTYESATSLWKNKQTNILELQVFS